MEQILSKHGDKIDKFELINGEIHYKIETQDYMSEWFKKCLKQAFPKIKFDTDMIIDVGLMAKIIDVYLYTW